jgi:hypothetical protein
MWKYEEQGSNTPIIKYQGTILFFIVVKVNASSSSICYSFVIELTVYLTAKPSYNSHRWVWMCNKGMCITSPPIEMFVSSE